MTVTSRIFYTASIHDFVLPYQAIDENGNVCGLTQRIREKEYPKKIKRQYSSNTIGHQPMPVYKYTNKLRKKSGITYFKNQENANPEKLKKRYNEFTEFMNKPNKTTYDTEYATDLFLESEVSLKYAKHIDYTKQTNLQILILKPYDIKTTKTAKRNTYFSREMADKVKEAFNNNKYVKNPNVKLFQNDFDIDLMPYKYAGFATNIYRHSPDRYSSRTASFYPHIFVIPKSKEQFIDDIKYDIINKAHDEFYEKTYGGLVNFDKTELTELCMEKIVKITDKLFELIETVKSNNHQIIEGLDIIENDVSGLDNIRSHNSNGIKSIPVMVSYDETLAPTLLPFGKITASKDESNDDKDSNNSATFYIDVKDQISNILTKENVLTATPDFMTFINDSHFNSILNNI